jgi:hypothetical protein
MKSHPVEFTELERYTIEHTMEIVDAMATTYNKVADLLAPASDELEQILKENAEPKGYTLDYKQSRAFVPFGIWPRTKKHSRLGTYFQYSAGFVIDKEKKGKKIARYDIDFGYCAGADHVKQGYFFYWVCNHDSEKLGSVPPMSVYEQMGKSLPTHDHSVFDGTDGMQGFEVRYGGTDSGEILRMFEAYRDIVVLPFLKTVP